MWFSTYFVFGCSILLDNSEAWQPFLLTLKSDSDYIGLLSAIRDDDPTTVKFDNMSVDYYICFNKSEVVAHPLQDLIFGKQHFDIEISTLFLSQDCLVDHYKTFSVL